ncbi:hypothetical protein COL154_014100 [Colletotrichum chrysophilum]|nr:hypothetical protein COL154_014100 [Colletotrichum chrysophilum]
MSVRRLAEEDVQPSGFAFTPENAKWAEATIRKYPEGRQQSAVIPLLMRAQEQDGWVTRAAIEDVADMLGMPYIRALEVATFYTQFMLKPVGTRAHVQACGTTPCMLRGSEPLMDVCRRKIHHDQFEANESGTPSWEGVECQGACVNAPMVMNFKDTYEDLTPERVEEIIDLFEAGKGSETLLDDVGARKKKAPETAAADTQAASGGDKAVPEAAPVGKKPVAAARPDEPDDLKMVAGMGPKIEGTLHELGIWTWKQIGEWTQAECEWVDDHLSFHGRIAREEWVKQAQALAKGGEAEYVRVFGKSPR